MLDELKFMDSYQFLDASLEALVENLKQSNHEFKIFNKFFENEMSRSLLLRKGIFPYSYFDSLNVLNETCLPAKESFYSALHGTTVSDEDYKHANVVFKAFKCKNFADYLELYQSVDVVLLAEVFLSFRRTALKYYELDPVHFVTAADSTWNAGLKLTKIELQLLNNVNDYIWFENQMRGGICLLGTRHKVANNPYIRDSFNPQKPTNYIVALDANNLYGYVMSQFLPTGSFSWLSKTEIEKFDILNSKEESNVGYILEVDLDYPSHLHVLHNDLPMAPEHFSLTFDMLSPYAKDLCSKFNLTSTLPYVETFEKFLSRCWVRAICSDELSD
ncbi:hypothetical protein X975_13863, partial [Stegodyphus mimosarum]